MECPINISSTVLISFNACVSFSLFCVAELPIDMSVLLKSPLLLLLSFFPFMSVNICLIYWDDPMLGQFSSVQLLSCVWLFATPWITARQASLSTTNTQSSLKLMSIESVMPSSHLILCRPLFLLPSIPPSIRVFSSESTLHMRWPKYWNFSFSIIHSNKDPAQPKTKFLKIKINELGTQRPTRCQEVTLQTLSICVPWMM